MTKRYQPPRRASQGRVVALKRKIGDEPRAAAHLAVARRWQAYYQAIEVGGAKALDPTKAVVDGGGNFCGPESDRRLLYIKKLGGIRERLGVLAIRTYFGGELQISGATLLTWVLSENCYLTAITERLNYDRRYLRLLPQLIDSVDVVLIEYGLTVSAPACVRGAHG
jgi:hypothetical protein